MGRKFSQEHVELSGHLHPTVLDNRPAAKRNVNEFRNAILDRLLQEIGSFTDELIRGSRKYRQLYSVSEQLPHDYHDRFLVELIQNANDAAGGKTGGVRILFDEAADGGPCLYVANRGLPFTQSNFLAICELGQSDKDPAHAIGNKGIGFRSVLQVCDSPRIYSDHPDPSTGVPSRFSGWCFEFRPESRELVRELVEEQAGIDPHSSSRLLRAHFGADCVFFEERERRTRLRTVLESNPELLRNEVEYLSPYSLPLPVAEEELPAAVTEFHREGFVTVVMLPLKDRAAVQATERALLDLDIEYLLFTDKLGQLDVIHRRADLESDDLSISITRIPANDENHPAPLAPLTLIRLRSSIPSESDAAACVERTWWLHRGTVKGAELEAAIRQLPRRWHGVTEVEVAVALESTVEPPPSGNYSIYLPTQHPTGTTLWANGPFFGNVARTDLKLKEDYNRLLLEKCAALAVEMLDVFAAWGGVDGSIACLDLLTLQGSEKSLHEAITKQLDARGTPLRDLPLVALEPEFDGAPAAELVPVPDVRVLDVASSGTALTPRRLREAGAPVPAAALLNRRAKALASISEALGSTLSPTDEELATWAEATADQLRAAATGPVFWNAYYTELAVLASRRPNLREALRGRRFLLTEDGRLIASNDKRVRLFAQPVRGRAGAGTEEESDPRAEVPAAVLARLAFLSPQITLIEDRSQRPFNAVGRLLREGAAPPLVEGFETARIVDDVLVPLVAGAKPASATEADDLYGSVLAYAFKLAQQWREAGTAAVEWHRLRVPTLDGWQPPEEVYFGPEWTRTRGARLRDALGEQPPSATLVPPDVFAARLGLPDWAGAEEPWTKFLRDQMHVADAPRLRELRFPGGRLLDVHEPLRMQGQWYVYWTNELTNWLGLPEKLWASYQGYLRKALQAPVQARSTYYLERQAILDGLTEISEERSVPYAELVGVSFKDWRGSLRARVYRPTGGWQATEAESTLAFALRHVRWLPAVQIGPGGERRRLSQPGEVWYVEPAHLDSPYTRFRYTFLWHLPGSVARSFTPELRAQLGLSSVAPIESLDQGLRLLGALARLRSSGEIAPERDREFGDLWRDTLAATAPYFETAQETRVRTLAEKEGLTGLRVLDSGRPDWCGMSAEQRSGKMPVYLPDGGSADPVLAEQLTIADLKNERVRAQVDLLSAIFGDRVAPLSTLRIAPEVTSQLTERLATARSLGEGYPWLARIVLAVYAYGRSQEMTVTREEFRRDAQRLQEIRVVEVAEFTLRIEGTENVLAPQAYFWKEQGALLINRGMLEHSAELAEAFQAFFEVGDLEHPLHRVLSALGPDSLVVEPEPEVQRGALRRVRISEAHLHNLYSVIDSSAEGYLVDRLALAICALAGAREPDVAQRIARRLQERASAVGLEAALREESKRQPVMPAPADILELARRKPSLAEFAAGLGELHGVSLKAWNDAMAALHPSARPLENEAVEGEFLQLREALRPAILALLRRALLPTGGPPYYATLKAGYDRLTPDPVWQRVYWRLPFEAGATHIKTWLDESCPPARDITDVLLGRDVADILHRTSGLGFVLEVDDSAIERDNRDLLDRLRDSLLRRLVAYALDRSENPAVPFRAGEAVADDEQFYIDALRSQCQIVRLSDIEAAGVVLGRFRDLGAFNDFGIEPGEWHSEAEWISALPVRPDLEASSDELLRQLRERVMRRRRTRQVLGREYELPSAGEVFEQLGELIDSSLPGSFAPAAPLTSHVSLGPPPAGTGGRGTGSVGPGRQISSLDRTLVGAVGEYLVYKSLCKTHGPDVAREAWRSANRRHFGFSGGDDGLGYDFAFSQDGILWLLEVKASQGEPTSIDLSAKEREEAERAARRRSGRRYNLVYVTHALTEPRIYPLGNPYARPQVTQFRISESGARVFFSLPAAGS